MNEKKIFIAWKRLVKLKWLGIIILNSAINFHTAGLSDCIRTNSTALSGPVELEENIVIAVLSPKSPLCCLSGEPSSWCAIVNNRHVTNEHHQFDIWKQVLFYGFVFW